MSDQQEGDFGDNLRRLRESRGYTQADLADRLTAKGIEGMNQSAISRIEKGDREVRLNEARAIAQEFRVSIDLLTGSSQGLDHVLAWQKLLGSFDGAQVGVMMSVYHYETVRKLMLEYLRNPQISLDPSVSRDTARLAEVNGAVLAIEALGQYERSGYPVDYGKFRESVLGASSPGGTATLDLVDSEGHRRQVSLPADFMLTVERDTGDADGEHQATP